MIFAVSDVVWNALIVGTVSLMLAYLQHRWAKQAAARVEEVKVALAKTTAAADTKLDSLAKVADATHTLVNSAMGAQKRLLAVSARALANKPGATSEDIAAAELAEHELRHHDLKQKQVDTAESPHEKRN